MKKQLKFQMGVSILSRPHTDPPPIRVGSAQVLGFPKENTIPARSQRGLGGGHMMFYFSFIRIGDNPIGGGAARCEKRLFLF